MHITFEEGVSCRSHIMNIPPIFLFLSIAFQNTICAEQLLHKSNIVSQKCMDFSPIDVSTSLLEILGDWQSAPEGDIKATKCGKR